MVDSGVRSAPPGNTRRGFWLPLLLYPSHTLPTATVPVAIAAGLACREQVFRPGVLALAFAGSWFIHTAGVLVDNHELLRRHPHVAEHPELLEALADGRLTLAQVRAAATVCLAAALACGLPLLALCGWPAVVLGLLGVAASLLYSASPWRYCRTGLAEPVFFIMFGFVAVAGAYYAQAVAAQAVTGNWEGFLRLPYADLAAWGMPAGALVTNVLLIDDLRDDTFDAMKGWRTGTVRFGPFWTRVRYTLLSALAYAAPVGLWLHTARPASLLPLLTLPFALAIGHAVLLGNDPRLLKPMSARASLLSCGYAVLWALGACWR